MVEFSVRRPISILMLAIGIVVMGIISFRGIPVELMPKMDIPEVTIITKLSGASAVEVETQVTTPLERSLATTPGLKAMRSSSTSGRSEIFISFTSDIPFMEILNQVKDRIDSASLPEGVSRPRIQRDQSREMPLLSAVISIDKKEQLLTIDELVRNLEKIDGVAIVSLLGAQRSEISIQLLPEKLLAYQINAEQIKQTIQESQKSYSAGSIVIDGRLLNLRLGTVVSNLDELRKIIIKQESQKLVRLEDVAVVQIKEREPENRVSYKNKRSLLIEVRKEATANAVIVGQETAEILSQELKTKKISFEILNNQATEISRAISEVKDAAISGGGLTAVMIYFLLQSFSATIVVLTSIPLSLLICMICMMLTGMSFNTMSLIGMALGIGMIVDSAIVVLDNINFYRARLDDPNEAALWGVKKVLGQVVISTLCTMTVFAPLIFAPGMIGGIFKDVSLVIIFSLSASIFMAIMIIPPLTVAIDHFRPTLPSLASPVAPKLPESKLSRYFWLFKVSFYRLYFSFWSFKQLVNHFIHRIWIKYLALVIVFFRARIPLALRFFDKLMLWMEGIYESQIFNKIRHTRRFIGLTVALLFTCLVLFLNLGSEFFPEERAGNLSAKLQFSSSMPASQISLELDRIEKKIIDEKIGSPTSILGIEGENVAKIILTGIPKSYDVSALRLQNILLDTPDLIYTIDKKSIVSQSRPIQVEVYGDQLEDLERNGLLVLNILKSVKEIKNPTTDIKQKIPEIKVLFDRVRLSKSQTDISDYVTPLKSMLSHTPAGVMEINGETLPISLSKQDKYLSTESSIKYFGIWAKNKMSYIEDVASLELNLSMPVVRHQEKKRMMLIEADLNGVDLAKAGQAISGTLSKHPLVKNVTWKIGGAEAERADVQTKMIFLVLISLLLIYVLMASQFENLVQPLIIMLAIPLCLIGTAIMLWIFGINVSAIVLVGIIILAGSCVGTSIIMIDSINQNLASGMNVMDGILIASKNRMRAVLLTQGTSVVGLLPLLFSTQEGAALQKSLSVTIIGGLTSSTILTMLLIPAIYYHMKIKELERVNVS